MNKMLMAMAGLGAALLVGGCQQDTAKLATGKVDTTAILRYDDDYQKMAQEYLRERTEAAREVAAIVRTEGGSEGEITSQATYDKLQAMEKELSDRWLQKTREFTDARMKQISGAAEVVCKEKGLDLVVIDSEEVPTVEFGAIDVTGDILNEMPGLAGGVGEASPSPGTEAK